MASYTNGPRAFVSGALLPLAGARLVLADPALAALAAVPLVATTVAGLAAGWIGFSRGAGWLAQLWPRPLACDGCGPLAWAWSRIDGLAWQAAFVTLVLLASAAAGMVGGRILAAPAMDALSAKAMRGLGADAAADGRALASQSLLHQLPRVFARALGHGALYLAGAVALLALALVPGGAAVSTPLELLWAAGWLFVDTVLYPLQFTSDAGLSDVARLARSEPARCLGFFAALTLLLVIPLASFLATPALVGGACLLAARARPAGAEVPEPLLSP